ncbi:hypothetical protein FEK33_02985 [Nocardia asteroides NBRC 15531]|uniref:Uncharacterized protein n=1 Tax=Nocardia asteroides NBRC 15531 TaxID=1110697 RepID=U5EG66_NOCAS|nr:hypothetical protein [Nocardia asteroides]TLF69286.1 hypothetical protein FEK33_02985 [Nocardia asteroides NBRC 15531]UGT48778.1 hypothetical protein LT345_30820 [Nocardia asteroides]GAD85391.1 hypothetical protein NCAST_31_00850 [Nocardia asteroides NBRC 15531]
MIALWMYLDIQAEGTLLVEIVDQVARSMSDPGLSFEWSGNAWFASIGSGGVSVECHYNDNWVAGPICHEDVLSIAEQYWTAIGASHEGDIGRASERFAAIVNSFKDSYGKVPEIPWLR